MKKRGFQAIANKALDQADAEMASGTPGGQTQGEAIMDALSNGATQVRIGRRALRVAPQEATGQNQPS